MNKLTLRAGIAALALTASATAANAGIVTGYVYVDQTATATSGKISDRPTTAADATFTFSGAKTFDDRIAPGTGNSDTTTIDQFLASAGVSGIGGTVGSHLLDNTYFFFTGTVGLNAGNNTFNLTQDDGFQFALPSTGFLYDGSGPHSPTPTTFNVNVPTTGIYNFEFSYGECCGGPAVISVSGGTLIPTPEPGAFAILGLGVAGIALGARRRPG